MMHQDLRSFVGEFEEEFPEDFLRVCAPVDLKYDIMALVLEYERRKRFPMLFFDNVQGHNLPVICNVVAGRRSLAKALQVSQAELLDVYANRLKNYIDPMEVHNPPFREVVWRGKDADLAKLPIPTYFPGDAGPYLTAGMLVAKHPGTGVVTEGYHRFQVKDSRTMGCSLHSRRRMFEYMRLYEERGENMPAAICLGLHPIVAMGSLSYPPPEISKFQAIGGLFGAPMEVARCSTIDLLVPAWSEIVIEGELLAGVREPEGPFGEFTGYFSARSTENVFQVKAICMRHEAWFQSIASGRAGDHLTTLGVLREVEVRNALRKTIPGVKDVHLPLSGCSAFTAFIRMRQTRPGEAKHAIAIALGVDHYLKFVVVVDDDVDVFDESDVLWAMATRVQADRDLAIIPGSLGAILDPSASEQGITAKLGIDATKPIGAPFAEKLVMDAEKMAWARSLADQLGTIREGVKNWRGGITRMQTDEGFAEVNGTRLYYEVAGSGHPLVLIHGFTLDTRMWDDQFEVFAQRYQTIRYDLRGFGKSAMPTAEPYAHPDDLRALMAHLGIDHAGIVGLSLGGAVAVDFAVTYPDATDTLIPVDAALIGGYEWVQGRISLAIRTQAQQSGLEEAKTFWLNHPLFRPAQDNPVVATPLVQMVENYSGWHLINDDPVRVPEPPAIQRLDAISTPTLIIVGERDLLDFHRIADILEQGIPGAKKVVMPGVGHMSNMEDPERFNTIVLQFLAEVI